MLIFSLASLGCAVMTNIWGLVVLRCVQAIGASCGQAGNSVICYVGKQADTSYNSGEWSNIRLVPN